MDGVTIDFDDRIYRETGISREAAATREVAVRGQDRTRYTLTVTKQHVGNKATFYFNLRNRAGLSVRDLKIRIGDTLLAIDSAKSQDAAVIEGPSPEMLEDMEILSESEKIQCPIRIALERPRETPPKKRLKNRELEEAQERGKMRR
jgi:hypothetical protein